MKHFSIQDSSGKIISENLVSECRICYKNCSSLGNLIPDCPKYGGQRRQGKISNTKGITFLCCNTTKTTKLFREKIEGLSYAYYDLNLPIKQIEEDIKKNEQQKVNRLVHNLTSINAHNIQEIYDLIPQEVLSGNWKTQVEYIEKELKRNSRKAALMFLRIAKHNIHMKSEFSIYKKLDRTDSIILDKRNYPIRNVFLNVLHTFFADFTNNKIYVHVSEFYGKVKIDYETIQVAFYHLIENASKYSKPNSTINIFFLDDDDYITLSIEMQSLYIKPEERDKILLEGVSGSLAESLGKNGDGIGMWRINQMMKLNEGSFRIDCGDEVEKVKGVEFSKNKFDLLFKKH